MQGIHLRKYGVAATIPFELYEVDGVDFRTDWTPAAGDVFMMRDEAAEEQVTNAGGGADLSTLVTDEGRGYSITLALEDMQAARVVVYLVDQATKVFLDKLLVIETYGNASAQHAFDLDTASVAQSADNETRLATIEADTNELQTDNIPGTLSTIDGIVDDILVDTAELGGAVGASISADIAAIKAETALIVADTNELQTDDIPGKLSTNDTSIDTQLAAIKAETALIVADTDELQTDNIPGALSTHDSKLDTVDGIVDNVLTDTGTTLDTLIKDIPTIAEFEARSDVAGTAATPAEVATALTTYAAPTKAEMDTAHALLATVAKQDVIDALIDAIKVVTDDMAAAATTMITGTVSWDKTNATTTVVYSNDITEATADHFNGRLFVPTSGALVGQYTDITDYELSVGEGKFTITALTEAPLDNTTFVIL